MHLHLIHFPFAWFLSPTFLQNVENRFSNLFLFQLFFLPRVHTTLFVMFDNPELTLSLSSVTRLT